MTNGKCILCNEYKVIISKGRCRQCYMRLPEQRKKIRDRHRLRYKEKNERKMQTV